MSPLRNVYELKNPSSAVPLGVLAESIVENRIG